MEASKVYSHVLGPTSVVASIICGLAVISNYCFPKQRKFPNVVLVWTCVVDLVLSIYMAMWWIDGPMKRILTATVEPSSFTCRCSIYIGLSLELSSSMVTVVMAYTLHATVVRNVDFVVYTKTVYYKFVAVFWSITLLYPLLTLVNLDSPTQGVGYCVLNSTFGIVLTVVPYCVLFIAQMGYIVSVLAYTFKIKYRLKGQCTSTSLYTQGQIWLCVRCVGVQFNQIFMWMNILTYNVMNIYHIPVPFTHIRLIEITPLFFALNGLIVLVGNRRLRKFICGKVIEFRERRAQMSIQHCMVESPVITLFVTQMV